MTTAHYKHKAITKVGTGYMINGRVILYPSIEMATDAIDALKV